MSASICHFVVINSSHRVSTLEGVCCIDTVNVNKEKQEKQHNSYCLVTWCTSSESHLFCDKVHVKPSVEPKWSETWVNVQLHHRDMRSSQLVLLSMLNMNFKVNFLHSGINQLPTTQNEF